MAHIDQTLQKHIQVEQFNRIRRDDTEFTAVILDCTNLFSDLRTCIGHIPA